MKALPNLFLLALAIPSITSPSECVGHLRNSGANAGFSCSSKRRILHQPLYPISWTPPPNSPEIYSPFFPQAPPPQPDSDQPNVPTISTDHSKPIQPPNHQVAQPIKKIAIGFSVSIATLSILAALAFCLHRYRMKYIAESIKLVRDNSQPIPTTTSSNVLYLGTLEPSNRISRDLISSPYHRLNAVRGEEEHRPSPELQRLPPLPRLLRHFLPSSASSDEETVFYSPRESVAGNSESSYSPVSQQSSQNLGTNATTIGVVGACKSTRRTNLSNFSVDTQLTARLPSPPPPPPPPLPRMRKSQLQSAQAKTLPPLEKKMKFQSPPSPLGKTSHSVFVKNSPLCEEKSINLPPLLPPPPPPPPPPPSVLGKIAPLTKTSVSSIPVEQLPRSNCQIPTLTSTPDDKHSGSLLEPLKRVQEDAEKPRLKPLHWDKVRASSDRATVWDQLKSGTFQLNEDIIESLFISNPAIQKKTTRRPVLPPFDKEKRVLDPKKSQNIAILLRALNVTREEVSEALLDGNPDGLGTELLETMVKMAPTKEEELKLKNYDGDIFKLGSAERFLKELLDIPFAFKRVDAMLYRVNFDTEVKYLQKSYETIEAACAELKNSRLFLKLLEAVLRTGNRMNVGTNRGEAKAFKLDTLLKLVDIKGVDGKTTLLHFVVQEIIRSEGLTSDAPNQSQPRENNNMEFKKQGLRVIAALGNELGSVRKAAGMDSDALSSYLSKLQMGLEKIKQTLHQHENNGGFFESMNLFVEKSEGELVRIKDEERVVMSHVKEVTEYFHGEMAKEEGHPLRIFVVVRDFLVVLDQVCKEVERMDDRRTVGSVRSFRISANASSSLPVFSRLNTRQEKSSSSSSDDDSST